MEPAKPETLVFVKGMGLIAERGGAGHRKSAGEMGSPAITPSVR